MNWGSFFFWKQEITDIGIKLGLNPDSKALTLDIGISNISISLKANTTGRMNCGCAYARYVRDTGRYSSDFFWGSRDPWLGSQFFLVPTRLYCQTEWMPVIKERKVFGPGFPSPIGHHWPRFLFWDSLETSNHRRMEYLKVKSRLDKSWHSWLLRMGSRSPLPKSLGWRSLNQFQGRGLQL